MTSHCGRRASRSLIEVQQVQHMAAMTTTSQSNMPAVRDGGNLVDRSILESRASTPKSASPRPFLRWAGSKRWLLRQMVQFLPGRFKTYYEPFLGSGALFFLLCPERALISDKCRELIDAYCTIRDDVSAVIRHLRPMKPDRALF